MDGFNRASSGPFDYWRFLREEGEGESIAALCRMNPQALSVFLTSSTADGETPLHIAARRGQQRLAMYLLQAGADPNAQPGGGLSPLCSAVQAQHGAMIALLLGADADPSLGARVPPLEDVNAYHLAAALPPAVMAALLQAPDHRGLYASYAANGAPVDTLRAALLSENADMLALLIDFGVPLNHKGEDFLTPAQFLIHHRKNPDTALVLLQMLYDGGADIINHASAAGETLAMCAARKGWRQGFDWLIDMGVAPQAVTNNGVTLLHAAAESRSADVMARALSFSFNVDAQDKRGETPLYVAARANRPENIRLLLKAGADPAIADRRRRTPDQVCQNSMQTAARKLIRTAQENWRKDFGHKGKGPKNRRLAALRARQRKDGFRPSNGR